MYAPLLLALTQVVGTVSSPDWQSDYHLALKKAEAARKPLAIVIGSGPDGWNALGQDGRLDRETRRILAEQYICLYFDVTDPAGRKSAQLFEARQTPTLVLSDRTLSHEVYRHSGPAANGELAKALERYSNYRVSSNPVPAEPEVRQSYYQPTAPYPVYQPVPVSTPGWYAVPCRG
jgi:hypothetical protein